MVIKNSDFNGRLMWATLFLGYFLYAINWFLTIKLNTGINETFFNGAAPAPVVSQSISWVVTLASGLSTFIIGYIIVKLSHKYASWLALSLLATSVFTAWLPWFGLYVFSRLLLGMSGSMLMVLIQSVLSKYFSQKSKPFFSYIIPFIFSVATVISFSLFIDPNISLFLNKYWRQAQTILGALTFIPLIAYMCIGQNFNINKVESFNASTVTQQLHSSFRHIVRDKTVWYLVILRSTTITLRISCLTFIPFVLIDFLNPQFDTFDTLGLYFIISFCIGSMISFLAPIWNRSKAKIKPLLVFLSFTNFVLFILVIITIAFNQLWAMLIFIFLLGYFTRWLTGILNFIPHDNPNSTSKRVTNIFVLFSSFSSLVYTFVNIICSLIFAIGYAGSIASVVIFCILSFVPPMIAIFVSETRPNGPKIPPCFHRKKYRIST